MRLEIITATQEEVNTLDDALLSFNNSKVPFTQNPSLVLHNYIVKDANKIIAGIKSFTYNWSILYIELLFVDENYRSRGLGSLLLEKVESVAKENGAKLCHLDTFEFQAKDFYLKYGYEIFGVLDDCPIGCKRYYLKKKL
jgi:GNAT superfamily N-acetyltransferase